jgi:hypothetical protein
MARSQGTDEDADIGVASPRSSCREQERPLRTVPVAARIPVWRPTLQKSLIHGSPWAESVVLRKNGEPSNRSTPRRRVEANAFTVSSGSIRESPLARVTFEGHIRDSGLHGPEVTSSANLCCRVGRGLPLARRDREPVLQSRGP